MIKYKEQMNKIYVDNDMKKRLLSRLKEGKREESISRGWISHKYGGFTAACCAFMITYGILLNNPKLISQKDIHINDVEYSFENRENMDVIYTKDRNAEQEYSYEIKENNNINKDRSSYSKVKNEEEDIIKNEEDIIRNSDDNIDASKTIISYENFQDIEEVNNIEENINNEDEIDNNLKKHVVDDEIQEDEYKYFENPHAKTTSAHIIYYDR
ncbi:MAG: hypothetical protein ACI398_10100 [Clostridium sp.]